MGWAALVGVGFGRWGEKYEAAAVFAARSAVTVSAVAPKGVEAPLAAGPWTEWVEAAVLADAAVVGVAVASGAVVAVAPAVGVVEVVGAAAAAVVAAALASTSLAILAGAVVEAAGPAGVADTVADPVASAAAANLVAVAKPEEEPWLAAWRRLEPVPVEWEGMP